jgi:general secretion pathway protein J
MKRQAGLTLIEILVAMSLLAILTVMGYRAFGNLLNAREHIMQTGERWIQLARVLRRVEADLQRLPRQPASDDSGQPQTVLQLQGDGQGQALQLQLASQRYPDGEERVWYRAGAGLQWLAGPSGSTPATGSLPLLAGDYRISWRVLAANGQWHTQWPPAVISERPQARALEMRVAMPGDEAVRRVWALP